MTDAHRSAPGLGAGRLTGRLTGPMTGPLTGPMTGPVTGPATAPPSPLELVHRLRGLEDQSLDDQVEVLEAVRRGLDEALTRPVEPARPVESASEGSA